MCQTVVENRLARFRNELMKNSHRAKTLFSMKFLPGMLKSLRLAPLWFGICWSKMLIFFFFFIIPSPGGVEMAACRWMREGIPLFRHNMMWLRVRALRWLLHASAGHVSCCLPLICFYLPALFLWFYPPSHASNPHSQLLPGDCGWPALIAALALSPRSSGHLKHSSTPPSSFWLT